MSERIDPTEALITQVVETSGVPLNRVDIGEEIARTHPNWVSRYSFKSRLEHISCYMQMSVLQDRLMVMTASGALSRVKGEVILGEPPWLRKQAFYYFTPFTRERFEKQQQQYRQEVTYRSAQETALLRLRDRHPVEYEELVEDIVRERR